VDGLDDGVAGVRVVDTDDRTLADRHGARVERSGDVHVPEVLCTVSGSVSRRRGNVRVDRGPVVRDGDRVVLRERREVTAVGVDAHVDRLRIDGDRLVLDERIVRRLVTDVGTQPPGTRVVEFGSQRVATARGGGRVLLLRGRREQRSRVVRIAVLRRVTDLDDVVRKSVAEPVEHVALDRNRVEVRRVVRRAAEVDADVDIRGPVVRRGTRRRGVRVVRIGEHEHLVVRTDAAFVRVIEVASVPVGGVLDHVVERPEVGELTVTGVTGADHGVRGVVDREVDVDVVLERDARCAGVVVLVDLAPDLRGRAVEDLVGDVDEVVRRVVAEHVRRGPVHVEGDVGVTGLRGREVGLVGTVAANEAGLEPLGLAREVVDRGEVRRRWARDRAVADDEGDGVTHRVELGRVVAGLVLEVGVGSDDRRGLFLDHVVVDGPRERGAGRRTGTIGDLLLDTVGGITVDHRMVERYVRHDQNRRIVSSSIVDINFDGFESTVVIGTIINPYDG